MPDFTLKAYGHLLTALTDLGVVFYRFDDRPFEQANVQHHVILRHDVDRLPQRALQMAKFEAERNIYSTYFFRTKRTSFKKEVIKHISSLGHEIGYHYECLSDTRGDIDKAWQLFQKELEKFTDLCEINSIAMHGRPFSSYDNRNIWNHYDYRRAGITLEAYLDVPWERYLYFTDVGGKWDNDNNLRDHVTNPESQPANVKTTMDLIKKLRQFPNRNFTISTHPERWPSGLAGWTQSRITDWTADMVKTTLRLVR